MISNWKNSIRLTRCAFNRLVLKMNA